MKKRLKRNPRLLARRHSIGMHRCAFCGRYCPKDQQPMHPECARRKARLDQLYKEIEK